MGPRVPFAFLPFGHCSIKHLKQNRKTELDCVINIFVIFRPIATRIDGECIRAYPVRLKKRNDSTRQQVVPKFQFL